MATIEEFQATMRALYAVAQQERKTNARNTVLEHWPTFEADAQKAASAGFTYAAKDLTFTRSAQIDQLICCFKLGYDYVAAAGTDRFPSRWPTGETRVARVVVMGWAIAEEDL